jgi:AcrR family transcriptional regulator
VNAKVSSTRRLSPEDREKQILDGAIKFFAEKGFLGQTRELALQLGITQPLLYRYFPTKRSLIERVFDEVYINKLDPVWTQALTDRSQSLHKRLCDFYCNYSALMEEPLNKHYIGLVEEKILAPICMELRHYCGLPDIDMNAIDQIELDHIWVMHGGLFYHAIRKHVYRSRVSSNFDEIVSRAVSTLLEGNKASQY